jgi:NAD(P)-dependent dehydrogenase (short-subunit alcohol dehydrogenase family)
LVVGASSGIGRSVAQRAGERGWAVAVAARRAELVEEVAAACGPGAVGLVVDVTDPGGCDRMVGEAAGRLGGLDAVVYAAGTSPLGLLGATTADAWARVMATNVIGAASVLVAALDHLRAGPDPVGVLLSSHSVGRPWPGLVPYAASKAGLDELARGLRAEEPWLRTVRVGVGPTLTSFADGWDPAVAGPLFERWAEEGYLRHAVQEPDEVALRILGLIDDRDGPEDLVLIGDESPA